MGCLTSATVAFFPVKMTVIVDVYLVNLVNTSFSKDILAVEAQALAEGFLAWWLWFIVRVLEFNSSIEVFLEYMLLRRLLSWFFRRPDMAIFWWTTRRRFTLPLVWMLAVVLAAEMLFSFVFKAGTVMISRLDIEDTYCSLPKMCVLSCKTW